MSDRALTVTEAAEALRFSRRTIERRIRDKTIRSIKIGGGRRIPAQEIARILTQPDIDDGVNDGVGTGKIKKIRLYPRA